MTVMVSRYWILKVQARFLSGDYDAGLAAAEKAKQLHWSFEAFFQLLDYHYYTGLTIAAAYDTAGPDQQAEWLEALRTHLNQLRQWAENCPSTFFDKHALVAAELARIEGRDLDAMRSYEEDAIRSARENGFVQNEGIAGELAARFYLKRGLGQSGRCLSPGRAFLLPALGRAWQGKAARSTLPAAGRAGSSTCHYHHWYTGTTTRPGDRHQGVAGRFRGDRARETHRDLDGNRCRAHRRSTRSPHPLAERRLPGRGGGYDAP